MEHEKFMRKAIRLSVKNVESGGGPFGAVIVKDGKLISTGVNQVTKNHDPTAHAEVVAIRKATSKMRNFSLEDCVIYSSCEPCPMCLSAIYWSGITQLYYGNTKADAAQVGFNDAFIYNELKLPVSRRKLKMRQIMDGEARLAFQRWSANPDKIEY